MINCWCATIFVRIYFFYSKALKRRHFFHPMLHHLNTLQWSLYTLWLGCVISEIYVKAKWQLSRCTVRLHWLSSGILIACNSILKRQTWNRCTIFALTVFSFKYREPKSPVESPFISQGLSPVVKPPRVTCLKLWINKICKKWWNVQ